MYVRGDLNESIKLEINKAIIPPGKFIKFKYTIKFPETLKPGMHENWIGIVEDFEETKQGVGAVAALEMQLWIFSPYPGQYLEGKLEAPNTQINDPINFRITLNSRGLEDILNAKILLKIFDAQNSQIVTLEENTGLIKSLETKEINIKWDAQNTKLGEYKAKAIITYGNKTLELEDSFKIGDILIRILNITSKDTPQGSIAKIKLDIKSKWNSGISDIYAEALIFQQDSKIAHTKSETINLGPWERKTLNVFWDTTNVEIGTYKVLIRLHYHDLISEGSVFINVIKRTFLSSILANKPILAGIIVLALIIIFNIILIIYLIKKNKLLSKKTFKQKKKKSK